MKELLYTLSAASVVSSLIFIVAPKNNKTLKFTVTVIFTATVVLPVILSIKDFSLPKINFEQTENEAAQNIAAAPAKCLIADILTCNKINYQKIEVFTNRTENGGISIIKAVIYSNEQKEKIFPLLCDLDFIKEVKNND